MLMNESFITESYLYPNRLIDNVFIAELQLKNGVLYKNMSTVLTCPPDRTCTLPAGSISG